MNHTFLLFMFFFVISFGFIACSVDTDEIKSMYEKLEMPNDMGRDVTLVYSEYGHVKARLTAPVLTMYEGDDPHMEFTEGMKVLFFNEYQDIESELTANYGIRYEQKEKMIARNDVVVINKDGDRLNTEELIWRQSEGKIFSDKFVKITTADEILYGDGLEANEDFSEYTILNIKGIIQLEDETL